MDVFCINSVDIHSIECNRDPCLVSTVLTYIVFDGMVEKPTVSAFRNFLRIENQLNIKKVIGKYVWMCFVSTVSTYIALNAIEILVLCQQCRHI